MRRLTTFQWIVVLLLHEAVYQLTTLKFFTRYGPDLADHPPVTGLFMLFSWILSAVLFFTAVSSWYRDQ